LASDRESAQAGSTETGLDRALDLVRFLRANCPWDASQTPESLIRHLLEEAHEVADVIREQGWDELEAELGDLLLNLAFQIVIGEEREHFTADSVIAALEGKMRRRHPHLYGLGEKEDWEALKFREQDPSRSVLKGIPRGLDPIHKAFRLQEKAASVGFDWEAPGGALEKLAEEVAEYRVALEDGVVADIEDELGDLLFTVVNLARLSGIHPGSALDGANRKFARRFEALEQLARGRAIDLSSASLETLEGLWQEAKGADTPPVDQ
jgi:MazG family protein